MKNIDALMLSVIKNKVNAISAEMLNWAMHCGVTTFMYEIRDCAFGLLDGNCGLISQSDGIPLFGGSLGPAAKNCVDFLGLENLEPGDVIICNDFEFTGNHTNDVMVVIPVFFRDKIWGFSVGKAHWIDIGAKSSYPTDARTRFEEGLRLPPMKIYKKGQLDKTLWNIIEKNTRAPDLCWGDFQAQITACRVGERRVIELLEKYGPDIVKECINRIYEQSEYVLREQLNNLPNGTWTAEDYLDSNGIDDELIPIKVTVTINHGNIILDFSGSAPEQPGPMNSHWITTCSAARFAIKCLFVPYLPMNEGFNRPIEVIAPQGSIFNATPKVPSFLCGDVASAIPELINKALAAVIPERVPACSGGHVIGVGFYGFDPKTGKYWGTIVPVMIGHGASMQRDGENYLMHHSAGGGKNIPVEMLEASFPLFVESQEFIPNSGGAGRNRGGLGTRLHIRLLAPATFYCFIEKAKTPHWGIGGGKEGLANNVLICSKESNPINVQKTSGIQLQTGDEVIIIAGGGGGYGSPFKREPQKVLEDVKNGYITCDEARLVYGVAIDPCTLQIDTTATELLRNPNRPTSNC